MDLQRYQNLCTKYAQYGCVLLTTQEEIEELRINNNKNIEHQKLHFLSKCGHESDGYFVNLKGKGTGINCRKCAQIKAIEVRKENMKDQPSNQGIEYESFQYIRNMINAEFEVVKTNEGCIADFIVRPIGNQGR